LAKKLKVDRNFIPCAVSGDDELYPNGIFVFNITKMIEYIHDHPHEIIPEEVEVKDFTRYSSIEDSKLESIKIGPPVILAEIAPGKYNLIDGNHRMEKARKMGVESILAYRLRVDQHTRFLTEKKSYESYVEYWNDKLRE
jgi:hypothetical protein